MKAQIIKKIRKDTGCGRQDAVKAFSYAYEKNIADYSLMIAYVKAKSLAVKTQGSFDERVDMFYENM